MHDAGGVNRRQCLRQAGCQDTHAAVGQPAVRGQYVREVRAVDEFRRQPGHVRLGVEVDELRGVHTADRASDLDLPGEAFTVTGFR